MKTGKELKISEFKNYNIVYGSVNNKHPKAVYVNISAWSEPKHELETDYNRIIRSTNKKIRQTIHNYFSTDRKTEFIKERTIIDLDIRESGIKFGKRSFISCEITLFLDTEMPITSELMKDKLGILTTLVTNKIFDNHEYFNFYRKKK